MNIVVQFVLMQYLTNNLPFIVILKKSIKKLFQNFENRHFVVLLIDNIKKILV